MLAGTGSALRKLLHHDEGVCESSEIVIRAIADNRTYSYNPLTLKNTSASIKSFIPRRKEGIFENGLSVIHEDKREKSIISEIAREKINPKTVLLAKADIQSIANLRHEIPDDIFRLDVIRDDDGFEGHTLIQPMPNDEAQCREIGIQLRRVFSKYNQLVEI